MSRKLREPKGEIDYIFCLIIGSVYLYSLTRAIFFATLIRLPQSTLVLIGVASIVLFLFAFHNKITRIISLSIFVILVLYILNLVRIAEYDDMHPWIEHFYGVINMIVGLAPFEPSLGRTVVWIVSLLIGALVVIFMFHRFSFYVLALTGALVFIITWGPGFARDSDAFLLFLFAFCVILVRKMNGTVSSALFIAPLCALAVWLANTQLPTDPELFVRRNINQTVTRVMENLSDRMFEIFNPTYFSFQATGFSGAGGRLGGPVTVNSRSVMSVHAPGGVYLAGATSNTYTGFSWIPTLEEGEINTHGLSPGQFEMLETAAALIRGATIANERASISHSAFRNITTTEDDRYLAMRDFPVIGVVTGGGYYLHSYLPIDNVSIGMGRQRTGTIFRPINSWHLRFDPLGADYMAVTSVLPTGDMQTPRLMSRGTRYHMNFLNVNHQLSFIEYLLRQTNSGMYLARAENKNWWQQATFGGEIIGINEVVENIALRFPYNPRGIHLIDSSVLTRDEIPEEYTEDLPFDSPTGYYLEHIVDISQPIFLPLSPPEGERAIILEELNYLARYQPSLETHDIVTDLVNILIFSQPEVVSGEIAPENIILRFDPETITIEIGIVIGSEVTQRTFFSPINDYWNSHLISPEITHFQNIQYFGVAEMQILFDLFTAGDPGFIPQEAYLLQWLDMFAVDVLAEYARQVRLHFTEVPEIVPQRVRDLTLQIVADLDNDFDRVMAIRDYLLRFPYTLTPAHVPRGMCFVDHFLFVGQEGYCTYFASAMAMMARIAGIPSRYVEGFVLPPTRYHAEAVTVTNRMAHAWAEVYLEGFGWIIVEATPTYAFIADPTLRFPVGSGAGDVFDDEWLRMMAERMGDPELDIGDMWWYTDSITAGRDTSVSDEETPRRHIELNLHLLIPALVAIGILTFLLVKYWHVILAVVKVRRLAPNLQVIAYFEGILDIVTYYTNPMLPGETPKAYGLHKGKRFAFKSDSKYLNDLINLYYKAKYSPHEISEDECELMEEAYFDMVNLLRSRRLPFVFFYLRYIRMVGKVSYSFEKS